MNEEMISYIVLGIIISVIVNIIFLKVKNLIDILRDRDTSRNITQSNANSYNITERSYTHNPPPIPVSPAPRDNMQTQRGNNRGPNRRRHGRPPIPPRREGGIRTPDMYPKCPRCGCKNKRGQRQLVAWDNTNNKWRCYNGHLFCS